MRMLVICSCLESFLRRFVFVRFSEFGINLLVVVYSFVRLVVFVFLCLRRIEYLFFVYMIDVMYILDGLVTCNVVFEMSSWFGLIWFGLIFWVTSDKVVGGVFFFCGS